MVRKRMTFEEFRKFPVYMDVMREGICFERIAFELFYDIAPFTAENFYALCTGKMGISPKTKEPMHYGNSFFHGVNEGRSYVKGGALCLETGKSGESIYGRHFPVDPKVLKHDREGLLSMSIRDQKASRSGFLITLKADQSLDSHHVVFGKVVHGINTLRAIGEDCYKGITKVWRCGVWYNVGCVPPDVFVKSPWKPTKWDLPPRELEEENMEMRKIRRTD